jgi:PAT family beta-lactamase induction signal transducer AmpG
MAEAPITTDATRTDRLPARLWPALVLLGFSSGLPQPLVDATLSTWLARAGVETADIVRLGYVTLPFALKFLWAPLVDRLVPPFLGRRRGWLLGCQLALVVGVAALARVGVDPESGLASLAWLAGLVALAGATQDLVVNGYTCDAVPPGRLAAGAGLAVWGYRAAWLVSGGLALVAADRLGWSAAYLMMAGLLALGVVGTLLAPPPRRSAAPASLRAAVLVPLCEWRTRLGARGLGLLLVFVLLYRLPDGIANLLAIPFLASLYDLTELGLWRGAIGLAGAGAGVALAAWSAPRLGTLRALFLFGLVQALSNLGYVGLDRGWWSGTGGLVGVLFVENLCGGLAAAAFVAFLMGFCTSASAATQYALLTAVTLVGPHLFREAITAVMERSGWSGFFLWTTAAAAPGLALLAWVRPAARTDAGEPEEPLGPPPRAAALKPAAVSVEE